MSGDYTDDDDTDYSGGIYLYDSFICSDLP